MEQNLNDKTACLVTAFQSGDVSAFSTLYDIHDLVVRVLEHHAHGLADVVNFVIVGGVHAFHIHLAAFRQQNGVEVLCQRGFAAAVGPQHRHELAALHLRGHAVQRVDRLVADVIAEL